MRFPDAKEIRIAFQRLSIVLLVMLCLVFSQQSPHFVRVLDRFSVSLLTSFYALSFPWVIWYLVEKPPGRIHQFFRWKPFAFIAQLSYGMYISHFLIWNVVTGGGRGWLMGIAQTTGVPFWLLAFGLTMVLTVGISWGLYTVLERPILSLKRFFPYETLPQPAITPLVERASS